MSIKNTQNETDQIYFCTFTCLDWLPLFEITDLYDEVYAWFNLLVKEKHQILGFVIMPNHVHLLIYFTDSRKNINTVLANGKRFLAYEIIKRLADRQRQDILDKLSERVTEAERKRKKKHRVFQPSSDIKLCFTQKIVEQKLEYIHDNPVSGKWNLAQSFIDYPHSSAKFYELNETHPKIKIVHYKEAGF